MYIIHVSHWVHCLCEVFWKVHFFIAVEYCCYRSTMETFKISNEYSGNDSEHAVSSVEIKIQTNTVCLASSKSIRNKVLLVLMIFIVVVMLQFPTILYYTKIPSPDVSLLDSVNLETCSVSCRIQAFVHFNNICSCCSNNNLNASCRHLYCLCMLDKANILTCSLLCRHVEWLW